MEGSRSKKQFKVLSIVVSPSGTASRDSTCEARSVSLKGGYIGIMEKKMETTIVYEFILMNMNALEFKVKLDLRSLQRDTKPLPRHKSWSFAHGTDTAERPNTK